MAINLEALTAALQKPAAFAAIKQQEKSKNNSVPDFELDDDGEEYMPVGIDGVLASTEKLLAMVGR